jgi:L-rhamnose mutarotase
LKNTAAGEHDMKSHGPDSPGSGQTAIQTKRFTFTLDLRDDDALIQEYRHWHASEHIWPEITKGIREVGILDMEIYLLGTRLFMVMEVPEDFDFERQMDRLAGLPRQKEWEAFVSRFQRSTPDAKSSEKWRMMERIFKLP